MIYFFMGRKIRISCGRFTFEAELKNTPTSNKIINEFPLEGNVNIWGEEIFFPVSVAARQEASATEEVDLGTIAYWPPGKAFCIFFGPTPVSDSQKPRAYSPVNIIGKIHGDLEDLKTIAHGEKITVDFLSDN